VRTVDRSPAIVLGAVLAAVFAAGAWLVWLFDAVAVAGWCMCSERVGCGDLGISGCTSRVSYLLTSVPCAALERQRA
jgi:hypothetical protein